MTRVATEAELRRCIGLDGEGLGAVEDGFARLGRGEAIVPGVLGLEIPEMNGAADAKAAYVRGWETFAIKVSTRFFGNAEKGLPTAGGMMSLLESDTGRVCAVLLDNGYLTTLRTALAGALAARYLAPERVAVAAVIGAGSQARWQLRALALVRTVERAVVYGRSQQRAEACAAELQEDLGIPVTAAASPEEAVRGADVVITTTAARAPLVHGDWLAPGVHVTAMGADAPHKNELDPSVFARAGIIACDSRAQCEGRGDLRHALAAGAIASGREVRELGAIAAGLAPPRVDPTAVSVCDLTGVGVQDTAIARRALAAVEGAGLGRSLS